MNDTNSDPRIVMSPLTDRSFTRDGVTVEVHIYRLAHEDKWTREVVDGENNSIVRNGDFDTDGDAHDEFLRTVETEVNCPEFLGGCFV